MLLGALLSLMVSVHAQDVGDDGFLESLEEDPLAETAEETSVFTIDEDEEGDAAAHDENGDLLGLEEDPFAEPDAETETQPGIDEETTEAGDASGTPASSWARYLNTRSTMLVNLMVQAQTSTRTSRKRNLGERAQELILEIEREARSRLKTGLLSAQEYEGWNTRFQANVEHETAAILASTSPLRMIALFESGWFGSPFTPRMILLYHMALKNRNESLGEQNVSLRFLNQEELYGEILDSIDSPGKLRKLKKRIEAGLGLEEPEGVHSLGSELTEADLRLGLNVVRDMEVPVQEPRQLSLADQEQILDVEAEPTAAETTLIDELTDIVEDQTEIPFDPQVSFTHEVTTMLGSSENQGLYLIDPNLSSVKEYRFVTTYSPQFRVQVSEKTYNFFRMSVTFSQSYEVNQDRFFDGYATLREIYSNYRTGNHQLRYGTQVFSLGKVDFDSTIDSLHLNNIMGLYTFDPEKSKDALPAVKYNWFQGAHTATIYLAPVRQQTFGMKFVDFRERLEEQEQSKKGEDSTFLRDYFGLQYQWTGAIVDTRIGFFHWFDANPKISFEYDRGTSGSTTNTSFEGLMSSYTEDESKTDFFTIEIDALWEGMAWKLDAGYFQRRNLYSYRIENRNKLVFNTVNSPHFAWATSLERTFPYFYWMMIYSQRHHYSVPENSHALFYENGSSLMTSRRDLERHQLSGLAVVKSPDNEIRVAVMHYRTWPFAQRGWVSLWSWDRLRQNFQLDLKLFRLETDYQYMLENPFASNQVFLVYTQKFSGY